MGRKGDKSARVYFNCIQCGSTVERYRSNVYSGKFCSPKCRKVHGTVYIICAFCGKTKEFKRNEVERGQHKYCSIECYAKSTLLRVRGVASKIRTCEICGKQFEGRVHSKVCSYECRQITHGNWVKENQNGENNAFFNKKHTMETRKRMSLTKKQMFADGILVPKNKGTGKGRTHPRAADLDWRLLRKSILDRDNNRCVLCDSTKRLEVHHIVPFRTCLKHENSNLATLCRECHKKTYGKEELFVDILRSKIKEINNGQ